MNLFKLKPSQNAHMYIPVGAGGSNSNIPPDFDPKNYVPIGRKVNGYSLTQDIQLNFSDVGAAAEKHKHNIADIDDFNNKLGNVENKSSAMIRSEIDVDDITNALQFVPASVDDIVEEVYIGSGTAGADTKIQIILDAEDEEQALKQYIDNYIDLKLGVIENGHY